MSASGGNCKIAENPPQSPEQDVFRVWILHYCLLKTSSLRSLVEVAKSDNSKK